MYSSPSLRQPVNTTGTCGYLTWTRGRKIEEEAGFDVGLGEQVGVPALDDDGRAGQFAELVNR